MEDYLRAIGEEACKLDEFKMPDGDTRTSTQVQHKATSLASHPLKALQEQGSSQQTSYRPVRIQGTTKEKKSYTPVKLQPGWNLCNRHE